MFSWPHIVRMVGAAFLGLSAHIIEQVAAMLRSTAGGGGVGLLFLLVSFMQHVSCCGGIQALFCVYSDSCLLANNGNTHSCPVVRLNVIAWPFVAI